MHEMSIAISILESAEKLISGGRLQKVEVAVGELSAVEPDLLAFAWEALTAEGPHQGAELSVDFRRADQYCPQCRAPVERSLPSWIEICARCGGYLEVKGGDELEILRITYDQPKADHEHETSRRQTEDLGSE